MELREKVYERLAVEGLFGGNLNSAIFKISKMLQVSPKNVFRAIDELGKQKRVDITKDVISNTAPMVQATFKATNKKYGFVAIDGVESEFFVADKRTAFNNDIVEVGFLFNGDKKESFITKVVERKNVNIIGQVVKGDDNRLHFVPDDRLLTADFYIVQDETSRAALNKKCNLKFNYIDEKDGSIFGTIDKVFGKAGDPIVENIAIAYQYGFTKDFNEKVMVEAKRVPQEVRSSELERRLDLRDKKFITIDPATCKDMDDAVYIEKVREGYKVYVAIADVSHYVKEHTEIDKEAYARGTSCYLGDGVYPMIPEELSNGICSLNENVDRLSLCAITTIDKCGNTIGYDIKKAVINSKHKLSYEVAEKIHQNTDNMQNTYADVKKEIDLMYEASDILVEMREKRGAISISTKEPTFMLDNTKTRVVEVVDKSGITSKEIIESFMVLANETVGTYFTENLIPALYRVHDKPNEKKTAQLYPILKGLNIPFDGDTTCFGYQKLLKSIKGLPSEEFVNSLVLRSLSKAKYQPDNIGHYGLGSKRYVHFTSPIRRYPDTIAHRLISTFLDYNKTNLTTKQLVSIGEHLTTQERLAESAERLSDKLLETMWAEEHVNERLSGFIHSVENAGINVKVGLVNMFIPTSELEGGVECEYRPNNSRTALVNRQTGKRYAIGEDIEFKVYKADRNAKMIYATTDLHKVLEANIDLQTEKEQSHVSKINENYQHKVRELNEKEKADKKHKEKSKSGRSYEEYLSTKQIEENEFSK